MTTRLFGAIALSVLALFGTACNGVAVRFETPKDASYEFADCSGEHVAVPFTRTYRMGDWEYGVTEKFQIQLCDGRTVYGIVRVINDETDYSKLAEYPIAGLTDAEINEIFTADAVISRTAYRPDNKPVVEVKWGRKAPAMVSGRQ